MYVCILLVQIVFVIYECVFNAYPLTQTKLSLPALFFLQSVLCFYLSTKTIYVSVLFLLFGKNYNTATRSIKLFVIR